MTTLVELLQKFKDAPNSERMPALFLGHGSPTYVQGGNPYFDSWVQLGQNLPRPTAVLCISAHWTTDKQTLVSAAAQPELIYDFYNFPPEMYQHTFPVAGSPELAHDIAHTLPHVGVHDSYGLDHGTWAVLKPMFPQADVPVLQLSIAMGREPRYHYELGRALRFLRRKGVLIVGSGNIVHNLHTFRFDGSPYDWALEFDSISAAKIEQRDDEALIEFAQFGRAAQLSINSAEHYYPLLYTLGLREDNDELVQFNNTLEGASVTMRSVLLG
ncbi:MAG: 4,5-DOPA dioxygenase extradiol [Formosimonas sp.]